MKKKTNEKLAGFEREPRRELELEGRPANQCTKMMHYFGLKGCIAASHQ